MTIETCEHGHLKRSCEVCDLREKIAALELVNHGLMNKYRLLPDALDPSQPMPNQVPWPDWVLRLRERIEAMSRVVEAAKAVAAGMQRRLDYEGKADVSPSTVCTWIDQLDDALAQLKETP